MNRLRQNLPQKKEETVFDRIENLVVRAASPKTDKNELRRQAIDIDRSLRKAIAAGDSLGSKEGLSAGVGLALLRGVSNITATPIREQDKKAIMAMGQIVDATIMDQPDYHYAGHFFNVAMINTILGVVSSNVVRDGHLSPSDMALRVVVGFAHDIGHTGGNNQYFKDEDGVQNSVYRPFHFEDKTNKFITPILERSGYDTKEIEDIQLQILGTEPRTVPSLFDKAESFYATDDISEREKIRDTALASFNAAYQPLRDHVQQQGGVVEDVKPSQAEQAFFDRLFVDRSRYQDDRAYQAACIEGKRFLATEDQLTAADLSFSIMSPETHAINTINLRDEFAKSGAQGLPLIENGSLHSGGFNAFLTFGLGIQVVDGKVVEKMHRNAAVQYLLYPDYLDTAQILLSESLAGAPFRDVSDELRGRKDFNQPNGHSLDKGQSLIQPNIPTGKPISALNSQPSI